MKRRTEAHSKFVSPFNVLEEYGMIFLTVSVAQVPDRHNLAILYAVGRLLARPG